MHRLCCALNGLMLLLAIVRVTATLLPPTHSRDLPPLLQIFGLFYTERVLLALLAFPLVRKLVVAAHFDADL